MTPREEKMVWILNEISKDAKRDVSESEGKAFNGRNVAEFNGKQNAMIQAIAKILIEVIKKEK